MAPRGTVEITDKGGWRREFPLDKNIIHIGSDARCDIVIESWHGAGLAPRHLQLITSPTSSAGYRLINMGPIDLLLGANAERSLAPRSAADLSNGEIVKLGEFTFVFRGSAGLMTAAPQPAVERAAVSANTLTPTAVSAVAAAPALASSIGVVLNLPQTQLAPDRTIEGSLTIKNLGDKPGVQFKVEVDGLDPDCYEIGPGPILFPNAEKQVMFRLHHSMRPRPVAGDRRFSIKVTAPGAYLNDAAVASETIKILPFFKHEMKLAVAE
jgi:hypothetical protein